VNEPNPPYASIPYTAAAPSVSGAPSYSDSGVEHTKQHLCFVAAGPLRSPEVVEEGGLRTGEVLSDDATGSVVLLDDTASPTMALPYLKPLVPPSLCPATWWPSLALLQLASRRASNTATPTMDGHCHWRHNGNQGAGTSCGYALDASRCRQGGVAHTPSSD
jgi:hypothetical protein